MDSSRLLTPKELGAALQVPVKTIYDWVFHRRVPFLKVGRHLRFDFAIVFDHFETTTGAKAMPCRDPRPFVDSIGYRSLKTRYETRNANAAYPEKE